RVEDRDVRHREPLRYAGPTATGMGRCNVTDEWDRAAASGAAAREATGNEGAPFTLVGRQRARTFRRDRRRPPTCMIEEQALRRTASRSRRRFEQHLDDSALFVVLASRTATTPTVSSTRSTQCSGDLGIQSAQPAVTHFLGLFPRR